MSNPRNTLLSHLRSLAAKQANAASPDHQLLEAFRSQHSETAFAALLRRHGPMVWSVCRRVLGNHHDAEDAFQAVFLVFVRKAASLRKRESVSSFLHGIAYRIADKFRRTEVRRAARERTQARPPFADSCDDLNWRELRSVLDEELTKLPEQHRAPLVLCYLEGKTQDEAARLLGWSKNTFRRRLERGRDVLGRRLRRRGVTLSAALSAPLLADASVQASLPPLLAANTIRAGLASATGQATGTLISAQVAALVEDGAASLLTKKTSTILALLASLVLGAGGLLAHRAVSSRTRAEESAAPQAAPALPSSARSANKDRAIEIKGRVLDPDGKPLAGARLFLLTEAKKPKGDAAARAATDKDGRFSFHAKPADFNANGKVTLVVTARGFGPDWTEVKTENKDAVTLRLAKDDVPIEGRVLDLEGQPVSGITVSASRLMQTDLKAWYEARMRLQFPWLPGIDLDRVQQSISCRTDKNGRFRLESFGRDRVVYVHMRGEKTANRDVDIVTRRDVPHELSINRRDVFPAHSDYVVEPSKPIIGTVRDKRTGKPFAGVTVGFAMTRPWILTTTDKQGRYRLEGVGKRQSYTLAAGGAPFTSVAKWDIADTPDLDPVTADFELERGIAVRGRLLDKATGKPVKGSVRYVTLADNPHLKDFATLNTGIIMDDGRTDSDGSFVVTGIPGPGLLCAQADDAERFCAAEINKPWKTNAVLSLYHAVVPIDPDEKDAKTVVQDILLEPGRTLTGSIVDPDGRPLKGAFAAGRRPVAWFAPDKRSRHSNPIRSRSAALSRAGRTLCCSSTRKPSSARCCVSVATRKDRWSFVWNRPAPYPDGSSMHKDARWRISR